MGDNGAGKSTLIKGLAGVQPYDEGRGRVRGEPGHLHTPRDARRSGIEVVYQDLALCDNLDIVQNMFLGREETAHGTFDEGRMEKDGVRHAALALGAHREVGASEGLVASPAASARPWRSPVRC